MSNTPEPMHWRATKTVWSHPEGGGPSRNSQVLLGYFYGLAGNVYAYLEECGHCKMAVSLEEINFKTVTIDTTQQLREAKARLDDANAEVEKLSVKAA